MTKKSKFDFWVSVVYPKCPCCWTVDRLLHHAVGRNFDGGGTELTNEKGKRVIGNRDLDWLFETRHEAYAAAKKLVAAMRVTMLPFTVRITDYRAYNAYMAKQPPPPKLKVGQVYSLKELREESKDAPKPKQVFLAVSTHDSLKAYARRAKAARAKAAKQAA